MALIDKLKSSAKKRFIDGVIGIFDLLNYMVSTIYEEDEKNLGDKVEYLEVESIKIASINGGILNIVRCIDETETLLVVGRIVEEADSHDSLQNQVSMLYSEEVWDDEDSENDYQFIHNWSSVRRCLQDRNHLVEVLDEIIRMFHLNEDFVVAFADAEVPANIYRGTHEEIQASFLKFIAQVDERILPKMQFSHT